MFKYTHWELENELRKEIFHELMTNQFALSLSNMRSVILKTIVL